MSPAAEDAIAFLFHVPGLFVLARRGPPPGIAGPNAIALLATLAAAGGGYVLAPPGLKLPVAGSIFAAGHVAWGVYLVAALRRERRTNETGTRDARSGT